MRKLVPETNKHIEGVIYVAYRKGTGIKFGGVAFCSSISAWPPGCGLIQSRHRGQKEFLFTPMLTDWYQQPRM
jgi:hypothetical protein